MLHRDIAFEFASWISPGFKLYLIVEFQRLKNDENDRLKLGWNLQRTLTKINYRIHTELKTLGIQPRRAMEQIVEYKNDPGNGYSKTLLCFLQLFIVSNRDNTYYFANNNARHFAFNADELVKSTGLSAGETELSLVA